MQIWPRCVLPEDAFVLHTLHSSSAGAGYSFFVDHIVLEPQVRNVQSNYIVHNRRHILRGAKHIHQVDACARCFARCSLR
jgi:hypothetical protein